MAENNKLEKSWKCYLGFILAVLCSAVFFFYISDVGNFRRYLGFLKKEEENEFLVYTLLSVGLVVALFLSNFGVKETKKCTLKGKDFGIAGIIISSTVLPVALLIVCLLALFI